jgi:hypothetical protein
MEVWQHVENTRRKDSINYVVEKREWEQEDAETLYNLLDK